MLTYDAHTSDAFFFSLSLNGTRSVVCFREEAAALRCRATLAERGGAAPEPRQLLLEEVLDYIDPDPLGGAVPQLRCAGVWSDRGSTLQSWRGTPNTRPTRSAQTCIPCALAVRLEGVDVVL